MLIIVCTIRPACDGTRQTTCQSHKAASWQSVRSSLRSARPQTQRHLPHLEDAALPLRIRSSRHGPRAALFQLRARDLRAGMLGGRKPLRPLDWRELERDAYAMLARGPRGYIQGGAGLGETIRANREAFDGGGSCRGCCETSQSARLQRTVLGTKLPAPVLLAPIGVQTVAHAEGELASARAAAQVGRAVDREHRRFAHDRADSRGRRRAGVLVSAVLAARPRAGAQFHRRAPSGPAIRRSW